MRTGREVEDKWEEGKSEEEEKVHGRRRNRKSTNVPTGEVLFKNISS